MQYFIKEEKLKGTISLEGINDLCNDIKSDLEWIMSTLTFEPGVFEDGLITYQKIMDNG